MTNYQILFLCLSAISGGVTAFYIWVFVHAFVDGKCFE